MSVKDHRAAYIFIVISIFLLAFSFALSSNGEMSLTSTQQLPSGNITITPDNLYVTHFLWYEPSVLVKVHLNYKGNASVSIEELPDHNLVYRGSFQNTTFFYFYFQTRYISGNQENYILNISGQTSHFSVSVSNSPLPVIGEAALATSIVLFALGVFLSPFRSRLWNVVIPIGYLPILAFTGQRYDMFFMIAGGFHLLDGVNPFLPSQMVPGALKWSYPPYYLLWSYVSDLISSKISRIPVPSSSSLIYPGVLLGNYYDAWMSFTPRSLPLFYLLSKIPMMVSVLLIFIILDKEIGGKHNVTKLWLLSPYVILVGIMWGQLDVIASLFLLVSVLTFSKGRTDLAVLSATVGFWIKIFPGFVIPFILIESKRKIRDVLILLLSSVPAFIIYYHSGHLVEDIEAITYARSIPTFKGLFNANGLTWQLIVQELGITHFPAIFTFTFPSFVVALSILYFYKRGSIIDYVIAEFLFFFITYNFVNPQYFIVLIPLFLLRDDLRNYFLYSLYPTLYVVFNYSFAYFVVPSISYNYFASYLGQIEEARIWVTASPLFIYSLVILFTATVIIQLVLLISKKLTLRRMPLS
ncbi:MAG: hypothetical protein QW062_04585 [Thermoplasmatales archaeon]